MALGFSRDSVQDLASFGESESEHENEKGDFSYLVTDTAVEGGETHVELKKSLQSDDGPDSTGEVESKTTVTELSTGLSDSDAASLVKSDTSSYGAYSGFSTDYDEYPSSYGDPFAAVELTGGKTNNNFFCCLFAPWFGGQNKMIEGEGGGDDESSARTSEVETEEAIRHSDRSSKASVDDDETSTGSDKFGEKLTDKERSAVLARLGLSQPETPLPVDIPSPPKTKGLLNGIPQYSDPASRPDGEPGNDSDEQPKSKRGILKHATSSREIGYVASSRADGDSSRRRSLFPVYEKKEKAKDGRHLHFAPMARVVSVKSRKNMTTAEKSSIWWQKQDYEDFKKTGRLVAKAMLEGGSEVWLMTNKSWKSTGGGSPTSTLTLSLRNRSAEVIPLDKKSGEKPVEDTSNKWWHKFGHSRRGLEHIASMEEGKQRQMNVRVAIRAVMDEQRKQRIYRRNDPEKIRTVYIQYSSWARELAHAAGASDAEAVEMNFCSSRRSREYYLLKHRVKAGEKTAGHVPDFMNPTTGAAVSLDANTMSQMRLRQKMQKQQQQEQQQQVRRSTFSSLSQTSEAIHDPEEGREDMAKKAAGFGTGDEHVSMAAVLGGMGAVSTNTPQTVGAH